MLPSAQTPLSYDDQSIIGELTDKHQVTQKNTRLLQKYYAHFLKTLNIQTITPALRKTLAEIALIFTEKSNFYRTVQGSQCPGICFSMNDILKCKSYSEISNLLTLARQVIETVKFREMSLKLETVKLLAEIEKGMQEAILFERLCWVFMKNTLESSAGTQLYKEKLINFAWYLYIDVKSNCFPKNSSFLSGKMLMVSVLESIVLHSLTYISPLILQKNSPKKYSMTPSQQKKKAMSSILQILLKQAQIIASQIINYQQVNQTFNSYFDHLVSIGVIKSFSQESFDFLCYRSLDANFRKVDRKISKEIQSSEIDLRRLISYELTIENDHKKTAIQDKLIIKHKRHQKVKNLNSEPLKKYKSHRVLNLDNYELQMTSSSVITESQISFPSNLFGHVTQMSAPGLHVRMDGDELRRFLIQKVRDYMGDVASYESGIVNYVENAFRKMGERTSMVGRGKVSHVKSENVFQAYEFYAWLADSVWPSSRKVSRQYILEESDSTHECLLIIAMGTVVLAESQVESGNPFIKLLTHLKPVMMDFFYTLICVQEMDLPLKLRDSFGQVMQALVNELMWMEQGLIEQISVVTQNIVQIHEQNSGKLALTCLLEKVSKYISDKVNSIQSILSNSFSPQSFDFFHSWSHQSFQLALSFIVYCPSILLERTLDQLILCSMYGMSKFLKLSVRFHDLIQAYCQTITSKPFQFEKTILTVKSSFSQQSVDLIAFYNSEFVSYLGHAFDLLSDTQQINLIYELCGDSSYESLPNLPFNHHQQAIILSPRINKSKSQTHNFRSIKKMHDKQNYQNNAPQSININPSNQRQLNVSFVSEELQKQSSSSQNQQGKKTQQGKVEINLEINQGNSRNPTRVKERRLIEEKESELCATHKGKHPIFAQLRKIDEE